MSHFHHTIHTLHRHDRIQEFLMMRTVRSFGVSFVSFFVPIYIYNSISLQSQAVLAAAGYFLLMYLSRIVTIFPAAKFVAKHGTKFTLVVSVVLSMFWFLTLAFVESDLMYAYLSGVVGGIVGSFFFTACHSHFAMIMARGKSSRQVSGVMIFRNLAMSLGPLAGGVIAAQYGFTIALAAGGLVTLTSVLFLDLDKDIYLNKPSIKGVLRQYRRKNTSSFMAYGFQNIAALFLWPLFVSLIIPGYDGIGLVITASLILSIVVMHLTGLHGSHKEEERQLRLGSRSSSGVHVLRIFASSPALVGGVNFLNDIAASFLLVPFVDQYYSKIRDKKQSLNFVVAMETSANIGAICSVTVFLATYFLVQDIQLAIVGMFLVVSLVTPLIANIAQGE